MLKKEEFKVTQKIREFILYMYKDLDNFPKKYLELKDQMVKEAYNLLEICYAANISKKQEKKEELITLALAKAEVIKSIIEFCHEKKLIANNRFVKMGVRIEDIIKLISGWNKFILNAGQSQTNENACKTATGNDEAIAFSEKS